MKINYPHEWNLSPAAAIALQRRLAGQVITDIPLAPYHRVAAVDVSFNRFSDLFFAAVVVVDAETLECIEQVGASQTMTFPYIPGLLSFREIPVVLQAFEKLRRVPDVILCDGQGIAHPRRMGIASHLGLCLDMPTVGSAKSLLYGRCEPPGNARGNWSPLIDPKTKEIIGAVLRTRPNVAPIFVSPGHLSTLETSIALVLKLTRRWRLPEPIRMAHEAANELRRKGTAK